MSLWPLKGHSQSHAEGQGPPSLVRLVKRLLVLWVLEAMQGVPYAGDGKIWNGRVKSEVKQGNGEISMTKKVKKKTVRTNYVQRVKHRVVVQLHVWKLQKKYRHRVHHWSLRMTRKYEIG